MSEGSSVESRLLALVADCAPKKGSLHEIRMDMSLRKDLGLDSVHLLRLLYKFEEEFGIELPNSALRRGGMTTVEELLTAGRDFLRSELGEPA